MNRCLRSVSGAVLNSSSSARRSAWIDARGRSTSASLSTLQLSRPTTATAAPWMLSRRLYGTECIDIITHARSGRIPGVDPDDIINCGVCHSIVQSAEMHRNDDNRCLIVAAGQDTDLIDCPWDMKWTAYHEVDNNAEYEDDLLRVSGQHLPYTRCGPTCCEDKSNCPTMKLYVYDD